MSATTRYAALDALVAAVREAEAQRDEWREKWLRDAGTDELARAERAERAEVVVNVDSGGVWTMRPDDERPELRYPGNNPDAVTEWRSSDAWPGEAPNDE